MLDFANLMVGALVAVTLIVQLRQRKILPSLTDVISEKMLTEASVLLGMGSFNHKVADEDVQAIYNITNKYR